MRVRLYKYDGLSDAANKLQTASIVWDSNNADFELYGTFSPYSATFTLATCYDVNLARYDYNGRDYFGSVSVATLSDGLYTYTVNLDPLTTAWYNGCMNTNAKFIRKNETTALFDPDNALATYGVETDVLCDERPLIGSWDFHNGSTIVMVVSDINRARVMRDGYGAIGYHQTPGPNIAYIFRPQQGNNNNLSAFMGYLGELSDRIRGFGGSANVLNVIKKLYVVPDAYVSNIDNNSPLSEIVIEAPTGNMFETFTGWNTLDVSGSGALDPFFGYYVKLNGTDTTKYTFGVTSLLSNSETVNCKWKLHLPLIGTIEIDPLMLPTNTIKIRVVIAVNYFGGFYATRLMYSTNGTTYTYLDDQQYFPITETLTMPKPDDGVSTALSITSNLLSGVAAVANENYIGAVQSAVSGLGSLHTASGSFFNTSGGNVDRTANGYNEPTITIHYRPYSVPQSTFAASYGYPANTVGNISTAPAGYVQTSNARLLRNGLPDDVVKSAEAFCDAGFRILPTTP